MPTGKKSKSLEVDDDKGTKVAPAFGSHNATTNTPFPVLSPFIFLLLLLLSIFIMIIIQTDFFPVGNLVSFRRGL